MKVAAYVIASVLGFLGFVAAFFPAAPVYSVIADDLHAAVVAFYERGYGPGNVTLVVMGDDAGDTYRPWVSELFGAPAPGIGIPLPPPAGPTGRTKSRPDRSAEG